MRKRPAAKPRESCVCGCTNPVTDRLARKLGAEEPGVCANCGHYLYLHFRDQPEPE